MILTLLSGHFGPPWICVFLTCAIIMTVIIDNDDVYDNHNNNDNTQ